MPRALCFCFAIVAAFQLPAAAAPVEDIPVPAPVMALAARLGVDLTGNRAYFVSDLARLMYANSDTKPPTLAGARATEPAGDSALVVPVALPAAVWSRAVFRRTVPPSQLLLALVSDRRAMLLARGFAGVDDETLTYFADHPQLITYLYERAAAPFAAFAGSLRIHEGRVAPPGGDRAIPLWEAALRASVGSPDSFVRTLYGEAEGRLAYLYDVIDAAPPSAAAFALGFWLPDENRRAQRFRVLALACLNGYREWRPGDHPFSRPLGDLALLLLRVRTDEAGTPAPPASRAFWALALDVDPNLSSSNDAPVPGGPDGPVDAAWIVSATADLDMYTRGERLDQFAFGQRVFAEGGDQQAAEVVRQFRNHRMLLIGLERMGIRSQATYSAAVQRAAAIGSTPFSRRFWVLSQFEGMLALLGQMRAAGSISEATVNSLVMSLSAVSFPDGDYDGGVALWIKSELVKVLATSGSWEDRVIAALAGSSDESTEPRIMWEGQGYRVDLPLAERQRLEVVRRKQGGHTLDLALSMDAVARALRQPGVTLDAVQQATRDAKAILDESAVRLRHPSVNLLAPGVDAPRDGYDWLSEAATDLSKITRQSDVRRAARIGASLSQLVDIVLGDALVSFAYAAHIGDPDGAALLAGNVALRHDFGLARKDGDTRTRMPWLLPRQDFQPGVPWHVAGSLLGLDVALAPMNLRRLSIDRIADAPKLSSVEREALAVGTNLIDPLRLNDSDRDAIARAIARGRERVQAVVARAAPLESVSQPLGFDGWRLRATSWSLEHEPKNVPEQFSLVDLLTLGGGVPGADLDAWGTPAMYSEGCICTRLPSARAWRILEGRAQFPMMATTMGDFNLAVALMLSEMRLPSLLTKPVLAVAMQDFMDELDPANAFDWWSLSRSAQALRPQRVEDYVAVAAAVDGPLVPDDSVSTDTP